MTGFEPASEIDANSVLISRCDNWTPALADLGTATASVQIANYAGSTTSTVSIPVAFASAVQNVSISHIGTTVATVTWDAPAVAAEPIAGYHHGLV